MEALSRQYEDDMREVKNSLRLLIDTLNQMNGGRKALLGVFAIFGGIVAGLASIAAIAASFLSHAK